jgi:indolepyruvate ferredoxin oxidoreductase
MAYKDEYEVARLLTRSTFQSQLADMWEQIDSIGYNLHPPLLRALGWKRKLKLGQWFGGPLRLLAKLTFVRREERELIGWYRGVVEQCLRDLTPENLPLALEIASLPDQIRGYEKIKSDNIARVKALAAEKLALMASSASYEPAARA